MWTAKALKRVLKISPKKGKKYEKRETLSN